MNPAIIVIRPACFCSASLFLIASANIIAPTNATIMPMRRIHVMKNSIDIYNSIKQGTDFTEDIENYFYVSSVLEELSLDFSGSYLYTVDANGDIVYRMTNPNVTYKVDNTLKLQASYDLQMPVWFAGQIIYWFTVPVTVSSSLTLK